MTGDASSDPIVRRAGPEDIDSLIEHRISLLRESGFVSESDVPAVGSAVRSYFEQHLPTGEFIAWVAETEGRIVAASGLVIWHHPPVIADGSGAEAYIMNMYTVPEWRGRGLASRLLEEILAYLKDAGVRNVHLHATEDGARIYSRYGFAPGEKEMVLSLP